MTFPLHSLHSRGAFFPLVEHGAYAHMGNVNTGTKKEMTMFIHAIHQIGRTLNITQILSEMSVATDKKADKIGLYNTEFALPLNSRTHS